MGEDLAYTKTSIIPHALWASDGILFSREYYGRSISDI